LGTVVADELGRWAARRAPELLLRAEEETVAMLRGALVAAALGRPADAAPTASQPRTQPAAEPETGELLWAYCVLRASDPAPADVQRLEAAGLAALVSPVPLAEFGSEPLRRNLNDLAWLEKVARHHEELLERAMAETTIVPLRLCTLYENEESVKRMLKREHDSLISALEHLAGRQEWGVKLLVDPHRLDEEARSGSHEAAAMEEELDTHGSGGAYMLRRRLERHVRERADSLAAELAEQVHARLQDWAIDAVTRPPQNRELSGHEGEMLLNAAYLVEADRVRELRDLVAELEERHRPLGARIALTGPWPPYNFVPGGAATE
jgi:hypothetical protein